MKKLVLISAYFGKLPNFFSLWLQSAENNSKVDFLIFSDCEYEETLPENVKKIPCTFAEIKMLFQSKFDFKIVLDTPYKLCDYKPAYGYVFSDYITEYQYWGHCDLDLIFGNIMKFFPHEEYDKIYRFGHLCVYRNTAENNRRFMADGGQDYKTVFTTPVITVFDELAGMEAKFDLQHIPAYKTRHYADIFKKKEEFTLSKAGISEAELPRLNYSRQVFYYENGGVFRDYLENGKIKTEEFNYIHFSGRKMPIHFQGKKDAFYITSTGFHEKSEPASPEDIKKLNPTHKLKDLKRRAISIVNRIKRKIFKIKNRYRG